jgi:hypothetical protein
MPEDSRAGDGRAVHSWTGRNLRAFLFYGGEEMKKGGKEKYSGPVTAAVELPKPKVLTREELHKELDDCLNMANLCKDQSYAPVIIKQWQYNSLLRERDEFKYECEYERASKKENECSEKWLKLLEARTQEKLSDISTKAAAQKQRRKPASIISKEFLAFQREQRQKRITMRTHSATRGRGEY